MSTKKKQPGARVRSVASASARQLMAAFPIAGFCFLRWVRSTLPTGEGMTPPRSGLLLALANKGERVSMGELGEIKGMSPRSMTVLVDGLEKEGLVRRAPHAGDRRVTLVEITGAGEEYVKTSLEPSRVAAAALFDDLTPEERMELLRLLSKVMDSLRARGIEVPAGSASSPLQAG
jgi:DNA-binding MarR family transcriptional regulator